MKDMKAEGVNPLNIAKYFIYLNQTDEARTILYLTHLLKFIYIAHGIHLARTGEPLSNKNFEAWWYGPVIPEIFFLFRDMTFKNGRIIPIAQIEKIDSENLKKKFNPIQIKIMDEVYKEYKNYTSSRLSDLTHKNGTPWSEYFDRQNHSFIEIPNDHIKAYYKKIESEELDKNSRGL